MLAEKVALITGAGSGIGRATACLFAREGALVMATDVNEEAVQKTTAEIRAAAGRAEALRLDVTNEEDCQHAVDETLEQFGRIDILANIAGIGSTQTVADTDAATWEAVFAVNVRGVFLMCKYATPLMLHQGGGTIINMGSVAGLVGLPNRAAYCASKGAVIALTKAMAVDYATQRIRVNAICPGTIDSPWVGRLLSERDDPAAARQELVDRQPMGRLGTPEEIAQAALYLASDAATFVTGTTLVIDGGLTAR